MNIFTTLTLIFLTLKLMSYIDWSWWLVFAPTILFCTIWLVVNIWAETESGKRYRRLQALKKRYGVD